MQEKTLMIFPAGQAALLAKPLSKLHAKALWWLAQNLPPGGAVITQERICRACAMSKAAVSRAVDNLLKKGFIQRLTKAGRSYHYRLNPSWFGAV